MATKTNKSKKGELRIRMYRVGFGDFFLMTVPTEEGPQHILIDCGVTPGKTKKGDIGTIKAAVAHMAEETQKKLALIIVTHRHQDHIIGFSRAAEIFNDFEVGALWMSFWETEYDPNEKKEKKKSLASEFQDELTALALSMQSRLALAGKDDPETDEILAMLQNATGVDHTEFAAKGGAAAATKPGKGGGTNAASLAFLKSGLGLEPQYYVKGDKPKLPKVLKDAGLTAQILGPPPTDAVDFMKLMDLKKGVGQYLGEADDGSATTFDPFGTSWYAEASDYPPSAFRELSRESETAPSAVMEALIQAAQPNLLFTAAKTLDNFLNNQSLVVFFTFGGKKLLFAGDAQGGNWEYWMYGGTPEKAPSVDKIDKDSASILSDLDFYKVGHHGSTNATPVSAVETMGGNFASMCSTQEDSFGSVANESEVPRGPLLDALAKKSTIVRSDQYAITLPGNEVPAITGSPKHLPKPDRGRFEQGPIYIDYFP
jgi:beta-lactamase superfamily II metal-dependent hydrolase